MDNITDESYIALICNGEFDAIPNYTIGELFASFFDNINYNVVKDLDNVYVDFTGETICNEEDSEILIRFYANVEKNEFAIIEVKVNDELLEEDEVINLIEDIAFMAETMYEEENDIYENADDEIDEDYYYDDFYEEDGDIDNNYSNTEEPDIDDSNEESGLDDSDEDNNDEI